MLLTLVVGVVGVGVAHGVTDDDTRDGDGNGHPDGIGGGGLVGILVGGCRGREPGLTERCQATRVTWVRYHGAAWSRRIAGTPEHRGNETKLVSSEKKEARLVFIF